MLRATVTGSGKSTWSKEYVLKTPNTVRINRDSFREMLVGCYGTYWDKSPEERNELEAVVTSMERSGVYNALSRGLNVIVDATNFGRSRASWLKMKDSVEDATGRDIEVTVKHFDTDVETCIERDSKREFPVGEEIIRSMYTRFYGHKK